MLVPVNVGRIVESVFIAARAAGAAGAPPTAAGLAARVARVADLCACLPYTLINEAAERRRAPLPRHIIAAAGMMATVVRAELPPLVLARLSDEQLEYIIGAVRLRYALSLVDYGTAAGLLAAQAISEPLTQYMLDSHHRSVAGGTSKAGLIRISEIYGAKRVANEQTSTMLLLLRPEALGPPEGAAAAAQAVANAIEHVTLRRFARQYDVLLEPPDALVYPPAAGDAAWLAEFARAHPLVRPPGDLTNWCFRIVLDKSALVLKAIELELIVSRLRRAHPGIYVAHTPEAVPEVVVRVWHRAIQFRSGAPEEARIEELVAEVLDTPIRGVSGIVRTGVTKVTRTAAGADGALVKVERLAVSTVGTNLYGACLNSAVDPLAAVSSSVDDTYQLLGIEAAYSKIISETRSFMQSKAPNIRHLSVYAAEMTRTGRVTSIERGGLGAREHGNVLLRMAYGAPIQTATDAAFGAARSKVYGIAAPQLLGTTPQIGTAYNELVVNERFVRENTRSVDSVLDAL